ncbi:RNA ligase, DRB0094 family [Xylariaceae sp. FL1019]|nr:RNA ligase, DRB0094 family [Xylariaceae sp. FL1019]
MPLVKRKLVTVRRITQITSIPNTRRHVLVKIDGWNVVAHITENFQPGQLVLYFEIDSCIPSTGAFWEYHAANTKWWHGKLACVVQTEVVAKQLSQGLIFPLHRFPQVREVVENLKVGNTKEEFERLLKNQSFENLLGVTKYETPEDFLERDHKSLGYPPVFIEQPISTRAQNMPDLFSTLGQTRFQVTEKLDGVPMSVYQVQRSSQWWSGLNPLSDATDGQHHDLGINTSNKAKQTYRIGVCGRTSDRAETPDDIFWKAAKDSGILEGIQTIFRGRNIVVQGELCGHTIMKNSLGLNPGVHVFHVFDIFDIDSRTYMSPDVVSDICASHNWKHVPVVKCIIKLADFAMNLDDLLMKAEGKGVFGQMREGLVFKAIKRQRIIFKVISNKWLIATDKKVNEVPEHLDTSGGWG